MATCTCCNGDGKIGRDDARNNPFLTGRQLRRVVFDDDTCPVCHGSGQTKLPLRPPTKEPHDG